MGTYTGSERISIMEKAFTVSSDADLDTKFIAVKLATNDGEVTIAGDGETAIGILQSTGLKGEQVRVMLLGISPVKANDAFAKGDLLNSGAATGKVDTAATTEQAVAIALRAATAQDDEVPAVVMCSIYKV